MDECFALVNIADGIEMSTSWFRNSNPLDDEYKDVQSQIMASIDTELNFNTQVNKFHRNESFQDACAKQFPQVNMLDRETLERRHMKDIGVLVCRIQWDEDIQKTKLKILESFVGKLGRAKGSIDREINSRSNYIRMYKNFESPVETDYYVIGEQIITSMGMQASECRKFINYKTSIIDPITYMLESVYSDVDSL